MMTGITFARKEQKLTMEVDGKCDMCKTRIETIRRKRGQITRWDIPSPQLSLIIDERKTDPEG
jgi:hypothetical protein